MRINFLVVACIIGVFALGAGYLSPSAGLQPVERDCPLWTTQTTEGCVEETTSRDFFYQTAQHIHTFGRLVSADMEQSRWYFLPYDTSIPSECHPPGREDLKHAHDHDFYYCTPERRIYVGQSLLDTFMQQGGVLAGSFAMAHEWAHHLQRMSAMPLRRVSKVDQELQADCIAGVYMRWAGVPGSTNPLKWNEFWRRIGSPTHGTSEQRFAAANTGYSGTLQDCSDMTQAYDLVFD